MPPDGFLKVKTTFRLAGIIINWESGYSHMTIRQSSQDLANSAGIPTSR